jgi:cytochrome c oxidase subunit 2
VGLAGLLGAVSVLASGCSTNEVLRFGWPEGVTPQATRMRELWTYSVIAALAVGVIVWALIFWTTAFHRKKAGDTELPRQTQYNNPLEVVYTVVPFIIVAVLFYFTTVTQNFVTTNEPNPDVKIDVTAFQWNWQFGYEGAQTPSGDQVTTVGSSSEVPLLVLPTGKRIQFTLASRDVIHSFWVPEFLFKRDVFPYPDNNDTQKNFQIAQIDREGAFVGRCTEMCGTYHSMMNFEVRALDPTLFGQYMDLRQQVNSSTGAPYTAAEALAQLNCGELCTPTSVTTKPFETSRTANRDSGLSVAEGN